MCENAPAKSGCQPHWGTAERGSPRSEGSCQISRRFCCPGSRSLAAPPPGRPKIVIFQREESPFFSIEDSSLYIYINARRSAGSRTHLQNTSFLVNVQYMFSTLFTQFLVFDTQVLVFNANSSFLLTEAGQNEPDFRRPVPPIAKQMPIFQHKIIIFQGKFSISSAFFNRKFKVSWHSCCNPRTPTRIGCSLSARP